MPFDRQHQRTVKQILAAGEVDGNRLFAKTGWAQSSDPNVGWYVGLLESGSSVYVFATMVRVASDRSKLMTTVRKQLTIDILRELGALPAPR